MVEGVLGIEYSRFAIPYPFAKIRESFRTIPTAHPGLFGLSHSANNLFILLMVESGKDCPFNVLVNSREAINRKMQQMIFVFIRLVIGWFTN